MTDTLSLLIVGLVSLWIGVVMAILMSVNIVPIEFIGFIVVFSACAIISAVFMNITICKNRRCSNE